MKREIIRRFPRVWRATRLARRWYHARHGAYPDWTAALAGHEAEWRAAREAAAGGPRVLFATSIGAYAHGVTLESALAVGLTLRGAEVETLFCDAALPACADCEASLYPDLAVFAARGPQRDLCRDCLWPAERVIDQLGLARHRYSAWFTPDERVEASRLAAGRSIEEMKTFTEDGLLIGEHAYAGALRFFASGSLDGEPHALPIMRRYFESAILTVRAVTRLLRTRRYTSVVATHGIYVPWGLISEVARREGVPFSAWNVAYRKRRFIFSHTDTYHHTLMTEPTSQWEQQELKPAQERELLAYLSSRREGLFDWVVFHRPQRGGGTTPRDLGLDPSRPIVGLLTNVSWDAQLHYPANAFPSMLDWLLFTLRYFERRPDLQLLVRVHPAEISGFPQSRQPILAELARHMPVLPANVTIVPPDSGLSTYALMSFCNAAIIYGTKMGVELTSVGLPVIVAGEAWIRNKGLTFDASSPDEYERLLERLPFAARLDETTLARARRYAYHFFFNRMIPLPFVAPKAGFPVYTLKLERFDQLEPGATPGLDVICGGILGSTPYVLTDPPPAARVSERRV